MAAGSFNLKVPLHFSTRRYTDHYLFELVVEIKTVPSFMSMRLEIIVKISCLIVVDICLIKYIQIF